MGNCGRKKVWRAHQNSEKLGRRESSVGNSRQPVPEGEGQPNGTQPLLCDKTWRHRVKKAENIHETTAHGGLT